MSLTNGEQRALGRAVGDVLNDRLSRLQPGAQTITLPAPQVSTNLVVDMQPVADALTRMTLVIPEQPTINVANDVQSPVVNVEVRPTPVDVHVAAPEVTVNAPPADFRPLAAAVNRLADGQLMVVKSVEALLQAFLSFLAQSERKPRKLEISHADGTKSTLKEV